MTCETKSRRDSGGAAVSLPVLKEARPAAPRSRRGRWRAAALIGVHVVIAAHFAHWMIAGSTVSPVEPSESMYTLELGVVNAGFIFFAAAILSTFVFGRFFCGWGCHVVALQDLCSWMLRKVGVRPSPFRSRLLVFVPLIFAFYMFVWPTVRRELLAPALERVWPAAAAWIGPTQPFPGWSDGLVTDSFWATFPSVWVAIPYLFVCGFAIVYFMGAKGFCTYGCPYGGIFGPVDQVAIGRIVVDHDRCESCGHCTAVCTSNVRVHEEIRDFGMVTDPGCMKCMDCVSVCPNDALSFRFAAPPVIAKKKRARKGEDAERARARDAAKRSRRFDLSWPEEVAFFGLFFAFLWAFRGLYNAIPLLMALGMAGCATWLAWKLYRMARGPHARLHQWVLRRKGRVTGAGWAFAALALLGLAATAHGAVVKSVHKRAVAMEARVHAPVDLVLAGRTAEIPEEEIARAREALRLHELAGPFWEGGIGLGRWPAELANVAFLRAVTGDLAGAEATLRQIARATGWTDDLAQRIAMVMAADGRGAEAQEFVLATAESEPTLDGLRGMAMTALLRGGRTEDAMALAERGVLSSPGSGLAYAQWSVALASAGRMDEAREALGGAIERDPENAGYRRQMAAALFSVGQRERALEEMDRAIELAPRDPSALAQKAQMLGALGRVGEAQALMEEAQRLAQEIQEQGGHAGNGAHGPGM